MEGELGRKQVNWSGCEALVVGRGCGSLKKQPFLGRASS
jgi:hypothetical protein